MRELSGGWRRAAEGAGLLSADGIPVPTIFAEMSAIAAQTGALNLGQGFPDEDGPAVVLEAARAAIAHGENQYPPGRGIPDLRRAIAEHQERFYGISLDPETEVLVTVGATEALSAALLALVDGASDEVVVFEPHYDAYAACVALAGGTLVGVPLPWPTFQPDLDDLRRAVSDRTRVILVNNPHNPTGTVFDDAVLREIVALAERHDAIILADEVYEHLLFDTRHHVPIATLEGARERTLTISSAAKTFSVTGWKIGWISGPAALIDAVLAVKQFLTYVGGGPFQPRWPSGCASRTPTSRASRPICKTNATVSLRGCAARGSPSRTRAAPTSRSRMRRRSGRATPQSSVATSPETPESWRSRSRPSSRPNDAASMRRSCASPRASARACSTRRPNGSGSTARRSGLHPWGRPRSAGPRGPD